MRNVLTRSIARTIALVGVAGMAACSAAPSSSLSPTAPSAAGNAGSAVSVGGMTDPIDPCAATRLSTAMETMPAECETLSGRFTGGGFQINDQDVKVTRGFTLHCDEILSNNFEVNWAGGNNFHIDKNPNVVECRAGVDPTPPAADVYRIEILGTGKLNGVAGAQIHLVLEDHGEPGREDRAYISINGGAALDVGGSAAAPNLIDGGNIQAHIDQPHK